MKVYKKDSKNKIRMLDIQAIGATIRLESGLLDGKTIVRESLAKPKNIGRANATTAEEQAIKEVEAKITKKLKEGYFLTVEEAEFNEVVLPMLAKTYGDEKHKIDWDTAYVQPKLDGIRMLDKPNERISRKNTPILTMDHISVIRPAALKCPTDGELYAHGLSFQENTRLIKKYRPGETEKVIYHIYDVISELPFIDRYALAKGIVDASTNCVLVPTFKVNNEDDLNRLHKQFLSEGYEGSILRWGDEGYKVNGRSSHLLKYKDFLDETYEVVDVEPSDKNPEQGTVICQNDKGDRFGCGMKFSHKEREEILLNKEEYIGEMAEVRFFEYTDGGIPRFPVCVGFRIDK